MRFPPSSLVVVVLLAAGCDKPAPVAPVAPPTVDAGAAEARAEVVVFTGAPGWEGGRACTDVRPEDGCDSQWRRTAQDGNGQVVRVFVVDVKEERALSTFVDKLAQDVASRGGVVDRFTQGELTLVRFLEPRKGDQGEDLAAINYALVGRDHKAVHLITSIVAFDAQQAADARVRELLGAAAWAAR